LLEAFPDLILERSLFVTDRNRVTCGGGTAALDMTLALIERRHGSDFAHRISDWFLHPDIRESTSAQRMSLPDRIGTANAAVLIAVAMMEEHIAVPVSLTRLADAAKVSTRQLNRLFLRTTGRTAMRYYRDRRLDAAANLLRSSVLSVTEIALATGFSSSSHFAAAYRARHGALPSQARR
jgi:transcriptional regulator GlxA family with amidase domain